MLFLIFFSLSTSYIFYISVWGVNKWNPQLMVPSFYVLCTSCPFHFPYSHDILFVWHMSSYMKGVTSDKSKCRWQILKLLCVHQQSLNFSQSILKLWRNLQHQMLKVWIYNLELPLGSTIYIQNLRLINNLQYNPPPPLLKF